ncbi:MAG: putative capsular polysaccharide synthesis family protein [Pseudomonadota bacterium]
MTSIDHVIVYQPGKVGSSAIMFAVQRAGITVSHVHMLNENRLRGLEERCMANGEASPPHVSEARSIRKNYIDAKKRLCVVSAVRDPVARNLSAFFENIESFCPDWLRLSKRNPDEVVTRFLENYPHHVITDWFDEEFKDALDIDVYKHPFSHQQGYGRYSSDIADAIVLRAEDENSKKSAALSNFLKADEIILKRENKGLKRHWGDAYRKIKKTIKFPVAYLDQMYDSKMAKYFYTGQERNEFRQRHLRAVE